MSEGNQSRLSTAQKADVWRRWKAGESLHNCIAVCCCRAEGWLQPLARARGITSGSSIRTIANGRAASTVSREVTRHGGRAAYRAHDADTSESLGLRVVVVAPDGSRGHSRWTLDGAQGIEGFSSCQRSYMLQGRLQLLSSMAAFTLPLWTACLSRA
jgi:hypothetical protein